MLKRFTRLIIAVLVASVAVTGIVSYLIIRTRVYEDSKETLLIAAQMIQTEIDNGLAGKDSADRVLGVFSQQEPMTRFTLIDRKGVVLYDTEVDQETMDNHLSRLEIQQAIKSGSIGSTVRRSDTLGKDMLYVALYDENHQLFIRAAMPVDVYQAGLSRILLTILIVLFCALIVLALTGFFATRLISRPLLDLEKAALAMSAGHYDVRVKDTEEQSNEITDLSRAYNTMADRLQSVILDLEDKNTRLDIIINSMTDPLVVVKADTTVAFMNKPAQDAFGRQLDPNGAVFPLFLLTHRAEADRLVADAMANSRPTIMEISMRTTRGVKIYQVIASPIHAAGEGEVILTFHDISENRKLQKMRSDFVANVTHELRTPLTSIRGFVETLRGGAINQPEVASRFLDIIDIEAERLHKLISDILILSEIEEMKADKDLEKFDLQALIDDVAVMLDETATTRKVSVIVENDGSTLTVSANPFRIKQILINLVENAIKYNDVGGKVFISAERQPDQLVALTVRDDGPGISPEHLDRIFERFYRVDSSRSREMGGTGLGLSIVKHIAMLYGGTAEVSSRPGEGAVFTVRLAI